MSSKRLAADSVAIAEVSIKIVGALGVSTERGVDGFGGGGFRGTGTFALAGGRGLAGGCFDNIVWGGGGGGSGFLGISGVPISLDPSLPFFPTGAIPSPSNSELLRLGDNREGESAKRASSSSTESNESCGGDPGDAEVDSESLLLEGDCRRNFSGTRLSPRDSLKGLPKLTIRREETRF